MAEFIEREAVKKSLRGLISDCRKQNVNPEQIIALLYALDLINEEPAADVVEVKHGKIKWVNRPIAAQYATVTDEYGEKHYGKVCDRIENNPVGYCGECGKRLDDTFMKYCPNCGAKMDRKEKADV